MASDDSGPRQHIAVAGIVEQPAFEHRLGQLLDEQRHAVGVRDDLAQDLRRAKPCPG